MAVSDAHVFPGFLTPVLTQLFFRKHPTTFLKCRSERRNTPERKFASTRDLTHSHQVMSPTHSPLRHPGGVKEERNGKVRREREREREREGGRRGPNSHSPSCSLQDLNTDGRRFDHWICQHSLR